MTARAFIVVAIACAVGCGGVTSGKQREFQWTRVATDTGEIFVPLGWHIRIRMLDRDPMFDLYSPDPALAVFVLPVVLGDSTLDAANLRQLDDIGAPAAFRMEPQPEGWSYGEKVVSPGQLFAACAVNYGSKKMRSVLAVARLMNSRTVSQEAYDAAGGRKLLCEIAASVIRLPRLGLDDDA